jgi:hypothetical protein
MKLHLSLSVILLSLLTFFTACNNELENNFVQEPNPLNTANLKSQLFSINCERDTVIKGEGGTILSIYKNSFVDKSGTPVKGSISFELKEALTTADILLAGLTTTSNGKPLETGGMIYINATANGEAVSIASDKYIGVSIPATSIRKDMQIFTGVKDSTGINWVEPYATLNNDVQKSRDMAAVVTEEMSTKKSRVSNNDIDAIIDYVNSDSAAADTALIDYSADITQIAEQQYLNDVRQKGANYATIDPNTAYIFSAKQLGWVNIDAFYNDERRKEVLLKVTIENINEFKAKNIYVSMVIQKVFLPGYQRMDNCYGFSHGDDTPTELPLGEQATVIATANNAGKLYFSKQTFSIQNEQNITLKLAETTKEELRIALQ